MVADLTWLDLATGTVAVASFGLSVYLYVKQRWERREASVSARLEQAAPNHTARLVITNYGPHHADEVDAQLETRGGGAPRGLVQISQATEISELPIPRLHKDESFYIRGIAVTVGAEPAQVVLAWRDGRSGIQRRTVHLSLYPASA